MVNLKPKFFQVQIIFRNRRKMTKSQIIVMLTGVKALAEKNLSLDVLQIFLCSTPWPTGPLRAFIHKQMTSGSFLLTY